MATTFQSFNETNRRGSAPREHCEAVTPSDSIAFDQPSIIWVGTEGDLAVVAWGDTNPVTYPNVPVGWFDAIHVKKVMSTNTNAEDIVRAY